jgi:putative addiction module component (TIGR02574 family)
MSRTLEDVRDEALMLAPEERLRLAQDLHDSLMSAEARDIEQSWIDEAERRYGEWRAGRGTSYSVEEVIGELRAKYADPSDRDPRRG